jgi:hypothetical protein
MLKSSKDVGAQDKCRKACVPNIHISYKPRQNRIASYIRWRHQEPPGENTELRLLSRPTSEFLLLAGQR